MTASGRRAGRVIVVGSVNVDLVVSADRLPAAGETISGGRFERHHGGKGGNQAVAAARLGAATWFVGCVGPDAFGEEARSALAAEGVNVDHLHTVPVAPSGVALVLVDSLGENMIAVAGGANLELGPENVRRAIEAIGVRAGDVLLVGHEISTASAREALRRGHAAGARTILNPAPVGDLDRSSLHLADILTPNQGELALLVAAVAGETGEPERAARSLLERGDQGDGVREAVLVTLGAAGAILVTADGAVRVPAPVVEAVDTVGAGDTLNGALAAGLAGGLGLLDAARRGVAAASLAVTRPGAREGMPTTTELAEFGER